MTSSDPPEPLDSVVDALCRGASTFAPPASGEALPSRDAVHEVLELLRSVLFPGYFGDTHLSRGSLRYSVGATLDRAAALLEQQIGRGLAFAAALGVPAPATGATGRTIARELLGRLPAVQALLASDVQAAYEGDPALASAAEAIFCYPGIFAITNARIAHELYRLGVPLIPRIITEHAHGQTGIDIHPGAQIGASFFIDHGTGVVIGETCLLGRHVRLYQGVTLGAKSFPLDERGKPIKGVPRHPVVEDDVIVYSGATILGRVTIGRGSTIGGNVWLTESVPPGSRVTQGSGGAI